MSKGSRRLTVSLTYSYIVQHRSTFVNVLPCVNVFSLNKYVELERFLNTCQKSDCVCFVLHLLSSDVSTLSRIVVFLLNLAVLSMLFP